MSAESASSVRLSWAAAASVALLAVGPSGTRAQFQDREPPEQSRQLEFMVGDWEVDGSFRQADLIDRERKLLWYLSAEGRLLRFDGTEWRSFDRGVDPLADEAAATIAARGNAPQLFKWRTRRQVRWTSGGFVLIVDDGRQGGQQLYFYSPSRERWLMQALHAPTETPAGEPHEGRLVSGDLRFSGISRDRRGEHTVETLIRRHTDDHYSMRQDVSFDAGRSWIREQLIYEVRRSADP